MRVALAALWVMGAVLGACASMTAPPGSAAMTPLLAESSFTTADGLVLPVRSWLPDGDLARKPHAVVVAIHGFNDYSKSFDTAPGAPGVGPMLAASGIAVFAYDQRGFGGAPSHGLWPGTPALIADYTAFVRTIRQRFPATPLYGLGESMGAAVVMTALASADPPPLDGAVLSSPAVWARSTMPAAYRVALWLGARFAPGWRPTGQSLGRQASDNVAMLRANGRDPLFISKTRIDSVAGLVDLMDRALAVSGQMHIPVLYLYGRHDQIIPPDASAQAMKRLLDTNPRARAAFYDSGWHMMLRDLGAAKVIGDIAAYVTDPTAPLPSGAEQNALALLEARAKQTWLP